MGWIHLLPSLPPGISDRHAAEEKEEVSEMDVQHGQVHDPLPLGVDDIEGSILWREERDVVSMGGLFRASLLRFQSIASKPGVHMFIHYMVVRWMTMGG